jgi:hypothetical protein
MARIFRPSILYAVRVSWIYFPRCLTSSQESIYNNIKENEIVMPEEHRGQLGFEYAWKELLRRARTTGEKKDSFLPDIIIADPRFFSDPPRDRVLGL